MNSLEGIEIQREIDRLDGRVYLFELALENSQSIGFKIIQARIKELEELLIGIH